MWAFEGLSNKIIILSLSSLASQTSMEKSKQKNNQKNTTIRTTFESCQELSGILGVISESRGSYVALVCSEGLCFSV